MRALALGLLAALLLLPAAHAAVALPDVVIVQPVFSPLCPPTGMGAAYCVRILPSGQGAGVQAQAGEPRGPHAASESSLALADVDGDGLADPAWSEHVEAHPCPVLLMVLPFEPPFWPCAQDAELGGSIDL